MQIFYILFFFILTFIYLVNFFVKNKIDFYDFIFLLTFSFLPLLITSEEILSIIIKIFNVKFPFVIFFSVLILILFICHIRLLIKFNDNEKKLKKIAKRLVIKK